MRNPNKGSPLNSSIDIDIDIDMYRGENNCMIQCKDLFLLVVVSYLKSQKTQLSVSYSAKRIDTVVRFLNVVVWHKFM